MTTNRTVTDLYSYFLPHHNAKVDRYGVCHTAVIEKGESFVNTYGELS
jgi:hypothetical protein